MAQENQNVTDIKNVPVKHQSNRVFIWLLIGVVIAMTLFFQIWNNMTQLQTLNRNLQVERQTHLQATTRKVELQSYIDLLNDDEYVLKLARARGFFSLPNEIIFTIPEDNELLKNEEARRQKQGE